jgi:hypothetical protein
MKLQVNLTIVVPAVENMPAHNASKPGDVVKSMSGQTIEIDSIEPLETDNNEPMPSADISDSSKTTQSSPNSLRYVWCGFCTWNNACGG